MRAHAGWAAVGRNDQPKIYLYNLSLGLRVGLKCGVLKNKIRKVAGSFTDSTMSTASHYNPPSRRPFLVSSIYADCLRLFDQLLALLSSDSDGPKPGDGLLLNSHEKIEQQLGRLRLWAANVSGSNAGL